MKSAVMAWSGLFLAPLVWFASLEVNFALAPTACISHHKLALYLTLLAAIVLALGSAGLAWSQRSSSEWRAIALAGTSLSIFSALVIVAQGIPTVILGGCE